MIFFNELIKNDLNLHILNFKIITILFIDDQLNFIYIFEDMRLYR
jgi:hypothetical protein